MHAVRQIKRHTTRNPKLEYGRELSDITNRLTRAGIQIEVRRGVGRPSIGTNFICQQNTVSDALSGHAF